MNEIRENLSIDPRFCGPPDSSNGGYICGRLARHFAGPVQVTLRRPPPLNRELAIMSMPNGPGLQLKDGAHLVAEAVPADLVMDLPEPPSWHEAEAAMKAYTGFQVHTFPTCFVCGPDRANEDGLRIFAGKLAGREAVASTWVPGSSLAGPDGRVYSEFLWAALDCPGAFAVIDFYDIPLLLGRLTADVDPVVRPGEPCVVLGWPIAHAGRKHTAGTALFNGRGALVGRAQAVWIEGSPQ